MTSPDIAPAEPEIAPWWRARPLRVVALASMIAWTLLAIGSWRSARARVLDRFSATAVEFVDNVHAGLSAKLRFSRERLLLLARSPSARAFAAKDPRAVSALTALFIAAARSSREVYQVRLISSDGKERIRVERSGGRIGVSSHLQSKARRYYFREARGLPAGDVFTSRIDLNVERGALERPLRPTLRFATPLRDAAGTLAGVLVINEEAVPLLAEVERLRGRVAGTLAVVDREGYYLSHPDASRRWGAPGMLRHGRSLRRDHPSIGAWIARPDGRVYRTGERIAVRPARSAASRIAQVLLVTEEREALTANAQEFLPLVMGLGGLAILGSAALVVVWRHRRLQGQLVRESKLRAVIASREQRLRDTQSRLVATERLAALADSSAALAHELRNPLGGIIASAAQLRSDPEADADTRTLMKIVIEECERLERTVSDFLDLARRRPGRQEAVDLAGLAAEVVAVARNEPILGTDIAIELDAAADLPPAFAAPDELRQVLWNLLRNAGSATRRAGGTRIDVRVRRGTIDDRDAILLEIVDEGPGPPSDDTEPDAAAAVGHGSGIGLIVAAGIVARHGGRFELVRRTDRQGACARALLPATASDDAPAL